MNVNRRDAAKVAMATAVAALTPATALARAGSPRDHYWYVNPELRGFVQEAEPVIATLPKLSLSSLPAFRKGFLPSAPPKEDVPWSRQAIVRGHGTPDLTVYVVNPKPGTRRGGILHTHGGGFVSGSIMDDLAWLQETAQALDCCIVSVDYRLAPEATWRESVEDNYAGLIWLHRNFDALGVDTRRLAVMGESAGGGHAALLAILARDRGEVPLVFQCLTYPMLDDRTGSSRSVAFPTGSFLWTTAENLFGWRAFLGKKPGGRDIPAAAVPARLASFEGLPPAWIGVGSIDLFVGEDLEYASRLIDAGVSVAMTVSPGAFHGFDRMVSDAKVAMEFKNARLTALKTALQP